MSAAPAVPTPVHRTLDLALRCGEVLLAGGAGAAEVTATCTAVAEAAGLHEVECDITFTSIAMSAQSAPGDAPVTGIRLVQQRELDYTRVTAAHNLVDDLVTGRVAQPGAERRLRELVTARHPYRRWVVTGARAGLAAAVAVLLGAGPSVTAAAFGATVAIDLSLARLARAQLPAFYQNVVGGLIATAVALTLFAAEVGVRPSLVVAGGIVLLLPGVTLVGAVQDAISGFYVTAAARAFETFLLTAGIIAGVAAGLSVGLRLGLPVRIGDPSTEPLGPMAVQLLAAAAVSACFAVANHAPRRAVPVAGAAGALGWAVFAAAGAASLDTPVAAAVAATTVGLAGPLVSRWRRVPALVHVVAGIIPLLPGLTIYRGMRRFAEGDTISGVTLLGEAVTTGLALAAGALLGEHLARRRRAASRADGGRDTGARRRRPAPLPVGTARTRWRRPVRR
ncbi:threonine/serine exporter family protein [Geodermatophilus marinus]|uniref:threonine/serine ThrE exporter family protein n=1 Tax=Geodermatophilus sp. LHW52908 TaxID=2303986 RepID=UPI000E3D1F05|nr:threonine/serine exporter family protein [Geodermatophilus sp. LHW52908]RFU21839.1 threonine/serine exporter family protein [Geodermatophilus sp. LHW52908]